MFSTRRFPILFVVLFALLSGVMLDAVGNNATICFSGFFHLLRWVGGAEPQSFSTYLTTAWSYSNGGDPSNLIQYQMYHVRFAWGFVYPLLSTLYAAFAEGCRWILGDGASYVEILVRAGSLALVVHWAVVVAVVGWAIVEFRDPHLRAKVAVAAIVAVLFDYLVHNHWATFNGHRLFVWVHGGFGYAMTLAASRGAVSIILGLYLAARALEAQGGRVRLIPVAFLFHLPVATTVCGLLLAAEAIVCVVRRKTTRDLLVLAVCVIAGCLASATVGFTGHPEPTTGILPAGPVLRTVLWNVIAHPVGDYFILLGVGAVCLLGGIVVARHQRDAGVATVLLVMAVAVGFLFVQFATGQAIVDRLLTWHDNPSVHSLLYLHTYASSAVALGISLWFMVRAGELVSRRLAGRVSVYGATAWVASIMLLTVFTAVAKTSRVPLHQVSILPQRPVGEPFLQIWRPDRWRNWTHQAFASQEPASLRLAFSDRRFVVGKDWIFNAIVYLRNLHQSVVWGPVKEVQIVIPPAPAQETGNRVVPIARQHDEPRTAAQRS